MTKKIWTEERLEQFKTEHAKAWKTNQRTFVFEGQKFVTKYAGFLVEFIQGKPNEKCRKR